MRLELAPGELSWRQLELQLRVDQCPAPDCPFHSFGTGPAAYGLRVLLQDAESDSVPAPSKDCD